jgi:hypothetical protein
LRQVKKAMGAEALMTEVIGASVLSEAVSIGYSSRVS